MPCGAVFSAEAKKRLEPTKMKYLLYCLKRRGKVEVGEAGEHVGSKNMIQQYHMHGSHKKDHPVRTSSDFLTINAFLSASPSAHMAYTPSPLSEPGTLLCQKPSRRGVVCVIHDLVRPDIRGS